MTLNVTLKRVDLSLELSQKCIFLGKHPVNPFLQRAICLRLILGLGHSWLPGSREGVHGSAVRNTLPLQAETVLPSIGNCRNCNVAGASLSPIFSFGLIRGEWSKADHRGKANHPFCWPDKGRFPTAKIAINGVLY